MEQQKKNWFRRHYILSGIGGLFLLFIILGMIGSDPDVQVASEQREQTKNESQVAEIKVSATELSQAYDNNKVAADAKYKDKILEISGIIDSIGKDILDDPYVTLKGREYSLFGIQCMFSRASEGELAQLSKGQSITLKGKVSNELIGNVLVRGCTIVR